LCCASLVVAAVRKVRWLQLKEMNLVNDKLHKKE